MSVAAAWIVSNLLQAHFSERNRPINPKLSNLRINIVLGT